jgi:hypothetical protein
MSAQLQRKKHPRLQAVADESIGLHFANIEALIGYLLRAPRASAR